MVNHSTKGTKKAPERYAPAFLTPFPAQAPPPLMETALHSRYLQISVFRAQSALHRACSNHATTPYPFVQAVSKQQIPAAFCILIRCANVQVKVIDSIQLVKKVLWRFPFAGSRRKHGLLIHWYPPIFRLRT